MNNKKGFTLAELLIVVAIISVLVGISIPVFTDQLEKSREATDLANVRAAYAEMMSAVTSDDLNSIHNNEIIKINDSYFIRVKLKQKPDWLMNKDSVQIGDLTYANNGMINVPGKYCTIKYQENPKQGEQNVLINWDGKEYYAFDDAGIKETDNSNRGSTWQNDGSISYKDNQNRTRMCTDKIIELEPKSSYTITLELPSDYNLDNVVTMGIQLYNKDMKQVKGDKDKENNVIKADSGWLTECSANKDKKTITYTVKTGEQLVNLGANFKIVKNDKDLKPNEELYTILRDTIKTFKITKND